MQQLPTEGMLVHENILRYNADMPTLPAILLTWNL